MDLAAYLERIGYSGELRPDLATLKAIHRAHLLAIPYENLDVQLKRPGGFAVADAFDKLVTRGRGGWCYEMNGVLGWALQEIGFAVTRVCGAVMHDERGDDAVGNHLVLLVEIEGQTWIADTGLGDGLFEPIPLKAGPHRVAGFDFQLDQLDPHWWRLRNHALGGAPYFDFTLEPADPNQLARVCQWLGSSPDSMFTQILMTFRFTPDGVTSLLGRVLRRIRPGQKTEQLIETPDDLVATLRREFGLDLPEAATLWPAICATHDAMLAAKATPAHPGESRAPS